VKAGSPRKPNRLAARRLAAAQKQALTDAARSGRSGEGVARDRSKEIDIALEDAEHALASGDEPLDPSLYPDEEAARKPTEPT